MHNHIDLTTPTTISVYAGAVVYLFDRKTGKPLGVVPLDKRTIRNVEAVGALAEVLSSTSEMKEAELIRLEAAKLLTTLVEKVSQTVQAKPSARAA
jgi:hypothetical protein